MEYTPNNCKQNRPGDPKPITALVALLRKNRQLVADEPVEFEKTTG